MLHRLKAFRFLMYLVFKAHEVYCKQITQENDVIPFLCSTYLERKLSFFVLLNQITFRGDLFTFSCLIYYILLHLMFHFILLKSDSDAFILSSFAFNL